MAWATRYKWNNCKKKIYESFIEDQSCKVAVLSKSTFRCMNTVSKWWNKAQLKHIIFTLSFKCKVKLSLQKFTQTAPAQIRSECA